MGWLHFTYRFILLPSFAGFVCCGCSGNDIFPNATATPADTGATATVVSNPISASHTPAATEIRTDPPSAQPAAEAALLDTSVTSAAYREGINLASGAYTLSQSAISPDDWGLVASRWQRAADRLKKLSETDTNYAIAQEKIVEYQRNTEAANAQIIKLKTPVHVPLATTQQATRQAIQPSTHQSARAVQPSRVPIVYRLQGTPVVRVTFNGTKTYDMILDTGASRTLITRQMANELGVVVTEQMIAATASQAQVRFDLGQMRSITLGNVTLQNAQVSIGDAVSLGLLGNDFLRDYDVIIRSGEGVVELVNSQYN